MASHQVLAFAALYFMLFSALGAEVPFLPNVLANAGLSAGAVGFVLAAGITAQIVVAPIFGRVADRYGARLVLCLAAMASAASLLLFLMAPGGVGAALSLYVLFSISTAPLNPLADAITVPACDQLGVPYGRVRGIGSLGFFAGIFVSSAIAAHSEAASILMPAAGLFAILTLTVPALPRLSEKTRREGADGGIRELFSIASFRRVLLVAAMVVGSHAMSDAFAVIQWRASGITSETIGVMLAIAVASEFVVFTTLGPVLLGRLGPSACAAIGAAAGGLRWAVLAESQSVWPVLLVQVLHGLTFSLVHLACMQVLASTTPKRLFATAQSLYSVCSNSIASAIITLVSGALFEVMQARAFWLASVLCLLAFPIALALVDRPAAHEC